jgi:fluoride exporter
MRAVLLVGVGGLFGVLARYGLSLAAPSPWTIVAINLAGSFLLGVAMHVPMSEDVRVGVGAGFLGGFTTFSTFTVQTVAEVDGGRPDMALAYLAVSVVGGLLAAAAGYAVARAL